MRRITFSTVDCLALPYFSTLTRKGPDFRERGYFVEYKICALIFSAKFCLRYSLFYEEFSEILLKMYSGLRVEHPLFLTDFNET